MRRRDTRDGNTRFRYQQKPHNMGFGHVLVVDLDLLPFVDETPLEQYERAERMMLHWTAEEERLRPALTSAEPRRHAAVIDSLKLLHKFAIRWASLRPWLWSLSASNPRRDDVELFDALTRVFPGLAEDARKHRAKVVRP